MSSFVCLLLVASFAYSADFASRVDKSDTSKSLAHSVDCGAISDQSAISLAGYKDWTLEQSGVTKAGWTAKSDILAARHALVVWFKKNADILGKSQLTIKSAGLSARKFDSINAISTTLKSGVRGRLKIVLRDTTGRKFSNKAPISTGYSDWAEFTRTYSAEVISFYGISRIAQGVTAPALPLPPFSIDHIQVILPEGAGDGSLSLSDLVVFGKLAKNNSNEPLSPYISWLKSNCSDREDRKPGLDIAVPGSKEPINIGRSIPISVSVNSGSVGGGAVLHVLLDRFGAEPVLLHSEHITLSDPVVTTRKFIQGLKSPGFYAVTARLSDMNGHLLTQASRMLLVWDPPGNAYQDTVSTFFGMMYPIDRLADSRKSDLELMRKAGVKIVRFPFRWSDIQPLKNQFTWHVYDTIMKDLNAGGFIAQPMVFNTPDWASSEVWGSRFAGMVKSRPQWIVPREMDDMATFMGFAAARYKRQQVTWEVWNEPTESQHWIGGDVDDYLVLLKSVDREVRRTAPDAKVISAGIGIADAQDERFAPRIVDQLDSVADGFAIHAYDGERQAAQSIAMALNLVAGRSNKGVWLNETGYLVDPVDPAGELRRSAVLTKTAVMARFMGAKNFTWFIFRNFPASANSPSDNYALTAADGSVRLPILAYANVARWLAGTTSIRVVELGQHVRGYEFSSNSRQILVAWVDDEGSKMDIVLPIREGLSFSGVYDMFGGPVSRLKVGDVVVLGHAPKFLVYERRAVLLKK